jgi:hypothetical protein
MKLPQNKVKLSTRSFTDLVLDSVLHKQANLSLSFLPYSCVICHMLLCNKELQHWKVQNSHGFSCLMILQVDWVVLLLVMPGQVCVTVLILWACGILELRGLESRERWPESWDISQLHQSVTKSKLFTWRLHSKKEGVMTTKLLNPESPCSISFTSYLSEQITRAAEIQVRSRIIAYY